MGFTAEEIAALQRRTEKLRNICILAHVDHGKTTLADCLISSNGIIPAKMAGKLRYLDSRPDEQEREITMKASSIALVFQDKLEDVAAEAPGAAAAAGGGGSGGGGAGAAAAADSEEGRRRRRAESLYLINLIDSPGHVDFSSEVSSAVRFSDGALVVVDAVEGVCAQTEAVLKQAWGEGVRPVLVLNKMDRLITEVKMSPGEAYQHLSQIVERMNALASMLVVGDAMQAAAAAPAPANAPAPARASSAPAAGIEGEELDMASDKYAVDIVDEESFSFSPSAGNVVFASAVDGWAFTVPDFADFYARRLRMKRAALQTALWGDFFFNPKTGKVLTSAAARPGAKPMFVQLVLDNLWHLYDSAANKGREALEKAASALDLKVPVRELQAPEWRARLQAVISRWLPITQSILAAVVRHVPAPPAAQQKRVARFWTPESLLASPGASEADREHLRALAERCRRCDPDRAGPVLVFVSKMLDLGADAPLGQVVQPEERGRARAPLGAGDDGESKGAEEAGVAAPASANVRAIESRFIAFARVFAGTLDCSQEASHRELWVFAPRFDPADPTSWAKQRVSVPAASLSLWLLMGRDVMRVSRVPAGNVCGIGGLGSVLLNSGTLSSLPLVAPFRPMTFQGAPIVRVAIEPRQSSQLAALNAGLRLLMQADPNVEIARQETGEQVLAVSGELHLERCLTDLRERFAVGVEIDVSPPLVDFRETVVDLPDEAKREAEARRRRRAAAAAAASAGSAEHEAKAAGGFDSSDEALSDDEDRDAAAGGGAADAGAGDARGEDARERRAHDAAGAKRFRTLSRARRSPNGCFWVRVRVVPVPDRALRVLQERQRVLPMLLSGVGGGGGGSSSGEADAEKDAEHKWQLVRDLAAALREALPAEAAGPSGLERSDVERIMSFGPRRAPLNLLVYRAEGLRLPVAMQLALLEPELAEERRREAGGTLRMLENSVVSGFHVGATSGPLCGEPMMGVALVVEKLHFAPRDDDALGPDPHGPMSGQIISTVKQAFQRAFAARSQRLFEPVYQVQMHCNADFLGKLHGVLARRRGRVVSEDLQEGTAQFLVRAHLPVVESFGFANDLRKRTSGSASPQLVFSHWQRLEQDPYWAPTTEEEQEEFGEVDRDKLPNLARDLVFAVRQRKGLEIERKIVVSAEKQRTLKRNK
jgi:ribosome assembly protein 1